MARKSDRSFECLHCGRVWAPRNPDSPKLKCPTCGKYLTKEVGEEAKNELGIDKCGDGGVFVPSADSGDLTDPCPGEGGENDLLLAGEKDQPPEIPAGPASCGSPELEEPIEDPGRPRGPSPVPASGLGGGLWVGLAVLGVGAVSAIWYLYRKRSLAEDLDDVMPDPPRSIPAGDPSDDLYGRGRAAYRRGVF